MSARRELAINLAVLASAIVVNLVIAPGTRWPFRLLALLGLVVSLAMVVRDLRRLDDARWGSFDLTVACEHTPQGVRLDGLNRAGLWRALRTLDPSHHRLTINGQPLDPGQWRELLGGRS